MVSIAAEISETGHAVVWIGGALGGIQLGRRRKGAGIQISVNALVNISAGQATGNRSPEARLAPKAECFPVPGRQCQRRNRKLRTEVRIAKWLHRSATTRPTPHAQTRRSARTTELVDIADREAMRTIEVGNAARGVDIALVVVSGVESRVAG